MLFSFSLSLSLSLFIQRKKALYILDLDDPYGSDGTNESSSTTAPLRMLTASNQSSKWEVSLVEWNPHSARSSYIASAVSDHGTVHSTIFLIVDA